MPLTKFRGIVVFNLIYMTEKKIEFSYEEFIDSCELNEADALLLNEARKVTADAYAPYSNFYVGAVAILENGQKINGSPAFGFTESYRAYAVYKKLPEIAQRIKDLEEFISLYKNNGSR